MSVTNVKRKSRNESEKKRRDAFNRLINDLTVLVANGDRKMDKSNVLKSAINFLKNRQPQAESTTEDANFTPDPGSHIISEQNPRRLARIYMDALNAGTFCISCHGVVHQASATFASLFNYTIEDLINQNFKDLLDEDSQQRFEEALSSEVLRAAAVSSSVPSSMEARIVELIVVDKYYKHSALMIGRIKRVSNVYFSVHPYRSSFDSIKKQSSCSENGVVNDLQQKTTLCYVGIARPVNFNLNIEISSDLFPNNRKSTSFTITYNNRFQCLHADYSCGLLLGYSRLEIIGKSGYDFVHSDDLELLSESHQSLIRKGVCQIEPHRFRTKGKQWIWLQCSARIDGTPDVPRIQCIYCVVSKPVIVRQPKFKLLAPLVTARSPSLIRTSYQNDVALTVDLSNPDETSSLKHPNANISYVSPTDTKTDFRKHSSPYSKNFQSTIYEVYESATHDAVCPSYSSILFNGPTFPNHETSRTSIASSSLNSSPSTPLMTSGPLPKKPYISSVSYTDDTSTDNLNNTRMEKSNVIISPTYRQLWEELQRKSDLLRQQVLQKEIELQQLQFKQFFATCRNVRP